MTWFGVVFVVYTVIVSALVVRNVGVSRAPLTPGQAAVSVIINILLIIGAVTVGTTP